MCLSEEAVKSVDPFYLVSMPGEVRHHAGGKCEMCNLPREVKYLMRRGNCEILIKYYSLPE